MTSTNGDDDFPKSSNVISSAFRAVSYLKLHSHALEDSILRRLILGKQAFLGATFCSSCNDESVGKHLGALALLSPRELQLVLKKPPQGRPSCPSGKTSFKPSLDWKRRPLVTNYSYKLMKTKVQESLLLKYGGGKPNVAKLTVREVAFVNPETGIRMAKSNSELTDDIPKVSRTRFKKKRILNNEAVMKTNTRKQVGPASNEAAPVVQVKLNSEGEVTIDPESLRFPSPTQGTSKSNDSVKAQKEEKMTNRPKWGFENLKKFYRSLYHFGTDFSLMAELFPDRTRRTLKAKFKSEEIRNRDLVNRAVHTVNRSPADLEEIMKILQTDRDLKSCGKAF
ncbi:hypothetical protein GE061_010980 [Apolygus lucorum]|uniref:Transcription factor TFIIIB component B'' Myb domain-containing protein n=1 Tax=Apolygus lucorum TaxID=248454 RepID=A0A8S9XW26_APOLU|nr:hypothetical protein GE061_010980 [Apolygus lucorum]